MRLAYNSYSNPGIKNLRSIEWPSRKFGELGAEETCYTISFLEFWQRQPPRPSSHHYGLGLIEEVWLCGMSFWVAIPLTKEVLLSFWYFPKEVLVRRKWLYFHAPPLRTPTSNWLIQLVYLTGILMVQTCVA